MRGYGSVPIAIVVGCACAAKAPVTVEPIVARQSERAPSPNASPSATASTPPPASSPQSESQAPSTSAEPPVIAQPVEQGPSAAEKRACAARGGTIQPICMMGELACVIRYRDGGKRCSDKRDCTGECLYEGPDPPPVRATGSCERTSDPCGCKAPVHHGHVEPTLCAD